MANYDSNYAIAQEISARIGTSPIPFDSVYSIALEIYNELGGEPAEFDSVYSILLGILPLVEGGIASKVIDDNIIALDKTWSSSKINEEIQAVAGTANSDIEGKSTEDFHFVTELPQEAEEDEQVVIKGENSDTLYKYVSGAWVEQTPDANKLYFDTENEALYSYVTAEQQFAPVSMVNTIVVGSNLNSNAALKAIKTPGVYSVVQRLHSTTKGDYIKNWTLTVEGVDYDEYERTDSVYQRIQSNYTIQKRTWSSTRATNDGWSNFSTYYAGEIKDTTTSKYYTWSSNKLTTELGSKQDTLTAGTNIDITNNTISAKGYVYDVSKGSFAEKFLKDDYDGGGEDTNTASGEYGSHAEGYGTTSSGGYGSHSEGFFVTSSGSSAHAEGVQTVASGDGSHAEGQNTTASGQASHAEGGYTIASGQGAHAEGAGAQNNVITASGVGSHAEGYGTTAQNGTEHAEGRINVSHKASDTYGNAGNTQHSVGINQKNAFEIMQNGDMYVYGVGGYQGTDTKVQNASIKTLQNIVNEKQDKKELDYLSFKNVGSDTVYVTFNAGNTTATGQFPVETGQYSVFQYSMNKGTWTDLTAGYIELKAGEVVYFRGILSGIETLSTSKATTFKTYTDTTLSTFVSNGCLEVDGDLRSMVDYTGINDDIVPFRGCTRLFYNNAAILNTPKMTSSILNNFAYYSMFYNCTNLTYVKTFKFKTLAGEAQCERMFQGCTSLTIAPELPSTQLAKRCYANMFSGCSSLKQAPELPSLLVPYNAYEYMFLGCTSLTIPPSTLPAMTIGDEAYYGMFKGCTSLKYTPDILVLSADNANADDEIYYGTNHGNKMPYMFQDCTSLSTIKLYNLRFFTSVDCLKKITDNVAANGIIYIASGSRTAWEAMAQGSGIPTGWTVIEI